MTAGQVVVNLLLISIVPMTVVIAYRRDQATVRLGLIAGGAAAALVVLALLVARRNLTVTDDAMLFVVVVTEEAMKILAVTIMLRYRTGRPVPGVDHAAQHAGAAGPVGWSVGAGFATAEHLLYATAAPGMILIRIAGAGFVHIATARIYSGTFAHMLFADAPYSLRRRRSSTASGPRLRRNRPDRRRGLTAITAAVAGILLHLGYNLLARHLDQIPTLW